MGNKIQRMPFRVIARWTMLLQLFASPLLHAMEPGRLQCEFRAEPLGIDIVRPRLGWICNSSTRGDSQTAYQILASSSETLLAADTGDLWDSGKVMSKEQTHVAYNGQALTSSRKIHWKVRVWDAAGAASAWSTPASWTMGLLNPADWQAQWIGEATPPTGATAAPGLLLRREFPVNTNLVRAVMHVSGLGYYTLTVNGNAATENLLEPGWTEYAKTVLYQTYDITPLLQSASANAVGLSLGHGVYDITGATGNRYVKFTRSSGELKAIAHIRLEYADGSTQIVGTDASWQVGVSPITYENLFAGEDHDARLEVPGWNKAGMAATWPAAVVASSPGGTLHGLSRAAPPIREHEVFPPKSVNPIAPGIFIYDMGQNASLMPRLVAHGPAGSRIRIIPAELLGTNGYVDRASATQDGVRPAWWQYTLKGGGSESWFPQFFYQGSRYWQVELTAATTGGVLPVIDSLEAVAVHADSPVAGSFETSSELFNKIWSLVRWAQRSNMMSVMTDCPHREKMPWLEQNQLNGPSLRYNFDMRALQAKVVNDMTDAQLSNGFVPNIAPEYFMAHTSINNGFRNSPEWGGSIVLIPWQQYQFSGDTTLLSTRYQVMKNYVAFLASTASNHIISTGLGDWYDVGPNPPWGSQLTPANLTATAHYFYFNSILAKTAALLGQTADATFYQQRTAEIRNAFNATFFNPATGTYSTGSQTANAMPLAMGIPEPQHRAGLLAAIISDIKTRGNALSSGEVGHRYLLRALADNGRSDVIYAMHSQSDKPGYGMQLARGATALTEKWDASVGSFGSQNHFMQGHIVEWFYHDLAGIQSDEESPGFRHIILKPALCGDITSCDASYDSVHGPITSRWTLSGAMLTLNVGIPAGSTATVHVPAANGSPVLESGVAAAGSPGVQFLGMENGAAIYAVGSGSYVFTSTPPLAVPALLSATADSGRVMLKWNPAPPASGYNIKRATASGGPYTTIAANVATSSYSDSGVTNGTNYYYVVSAVNAAGESENSEETSATPALVPNGSFEDPATTSFQYNPVGNPWAFSVQSGTNGSGVARNGSLFSASNPAAPEGLQVAFLQGTGTITRPLTGLTPGVSYDVLFSAAQRVSGTSWNVNGQTWKITRDGATIATYAPGQAATGYSGYHATFTATASSHVLAFVGTNTRTGDNTVFIDDVRVSRSPTIVLPNGGFETPATTTFTYNPADTAWTFGSQSGSNGSGVARNGSIFTANNPAAPEGVQVGFIQGTRSITRTLSGLSPGTRYNLLFSSAQRAVYQNGGQTWKVTLDGATIGTYKPGTSPAYTGYAATFAATSASHTLAFVGTNTNTGDNTAFIDNVRLGPAAPAPPLNLTATSGVLQVTLQWDAVEGVLGYVIKRTSGSEAPTILPGNGTSTTYTDTNLAGGTTYTYSVSAIDEAGPGGASATATATAGLAPVEEEDRKAPALALVTNGSGGLNASFTVRHSVTGRTYVLQTSSDLSEESWQAVPGIDPQSGTGSNLQFVTPLPPSEEKRFYRILIQF